MNKIQPGRTVSSEDPIVARSVIGFLTAPLGLLALTAGIIAA